MLAALATLLAVIELATRRDCQPGYSRLLDPVLPLLLVAVLVTAAALGIWGTARRRNLHRLGASTAILLAGLALGTVSALVFLHATVGDTGSCWTF